MKPFFPGARVENKPVMAKPPRQKLSALAGKFAVVGLFNTFVHVATTVLAVEEFGVHPVPASVAGFTLAFCVSFVLNTYWTFKQKDQLHRRFSRFLIVSISAMLLNTAIMYLAVDILHIHYMLGLATVLIVVPLYNFLLNLKWSYRVD
jgi:putative flippase GtrA